MLNLESTDKLQLVTSASGDIDVTVSYVDDVIETAGPPRVDIFNADKQITPPITTATTTDICAAPAATVIRNIKFISIVNVHASTSNTVQVQINVSAVLTVISPNVCILLFGESLMLREGVWFHYDANGGVYGQALPVASDTVAGAVKMATQAESEAASSTAVACSPGRQHLHPGMAKFVCMTTGGAAPTSQTPPAYNLTSITDTGVGRLTVTIATDFSSANWCCQAMVMYSSTTLTNATVWASVHIRSGTMAAGTVEINAHNWVTITSALVDPSNYNVNGYGDHA